MTAIPPETTPSIRPRRGRPSVADDPEHALNRAAALRLRRHGVGLEIVARVFDVEPRTIQRWCRMAREGGDTTIPMDDDEGS